MSNDHNQNTPAPPPRATDTGPARAEPQWIVNDIGELGVLIGGRAYFLYKGHSLVYDTGLHDDGTPMLYRMVGKREFGEVCHPIDWYEKKLGLEGRYTRELVFTPGFSFGSPEDGEWKPLPIETPAPVPVVEEAEGLEGRVRAAVAELRREVNDILGAKEQYIGYPQGCVRGRMRAVALLEAALSTAPLPHPAPPVPPAAAEPGDLLVQNIIRDICELDYESPADNPGLLTMTVNELEIILQERLRAAFEAATEGGGDGAQEKGTAGK